MDQVVCPGCGVTRPARAAGSPPGPTHPYMTSSPECWAAFGELLAGQYSNPERMAFHQVVVDAYAVQHPGIPTGVPDPRAVQSVALHLMTLCLFLEENVDPALGTRLHAQMVVRPTFWYLAPPQFRGELDVTSVPLDGGSAAAREASFAWARSAWSAWREHHTTVRGWLVESGLT